MTLFEKASEQLRHEIAQRLLHLHSGQQRGSSLLAHNVNLALIKASVGTLVDNRKSLFIEKHPVVGLRVDDPSCCRPAERHMVAMVEPRISSSQFAEQSYISLRQTTKASSIYVHEMAALVLRQTCRNFWYVLFKISVLSDPPMFGGHYT